MKGFVDCHCDTIVKLWEEKSDLKENGLHMDLSRLKRYESSLQVFALWLDPCYYSHSMKQTMRYIDFYYQQMEKNRESIGHVQSFAHIRQNEKAGKASSLLALEGGEALEGDLSMLAIYYRLGVRMMTLTWNYRNQLANGIGADSYGKGGLTPFGHEVVKKMEQLGMIVDVSHLSERAFWDVDEITSKPFIASHSNAKAICAAPRNLSDSQLLAIKEKGGVVGLNFYPPFLTKNVHATVEDILRHTEHMLKIMGEDHICFGSDFDGVDSLPEGINGVQDMERLMERMEKAFGPDVAEKIAKKNMMRILEAIL